MKRYRVTFGKGFGDHHVIEGMFESVQVEELEYEYGVEVRFSEAATGRLYAYPCTVYPKLMVGDIVYASANHAPAKITRSINLPRGREHLTKVTQEDVIWRNKP